MGAAGALLALVIGPEVIAATGDASGGYSELLDIVRLSALAFLVVMASSLGAAAILEAIPLSVRASNPVVRARAWLAAVFGVVACLPMVFVISGG